MLNPFKEVNWRPDTAARRVFAKSLMIGLPCVAVLFAVLRWLKTGVWDASSAVVYGGAGFAAGAIFYALPGIALPFYLVWFGAACAMGFIVGNVLMAVLFYVFVTGTGLLKRCFSRPALSKTFDRNAPTYWLPGPPVRPAASYYKQF